MKNFLQIYGIKSTVVVKFHPRKASLTPTHFIEVLIPRQEMERCICVLGVFILHFLLRFFNWILELFRQFVSRLFEPVYILFIPCFISNRLSSVCLKSYRWTINMIMFDSNENIILYRVLYWSVRSISWKYYLQNKCGNNNR